MMAGDPACEDSLLNFFIAFSVLMDRISYSVRRLDNAS